MFDTKSDYSLNKNDPDAIVCRSIDGVHIRLTRENFDSEEEFQRWKNWSDEDYYTTENTKRSYYDNCLALNEALDVPLPSAEDEMLAPMLMAESDERRAVLLEMVRSSLTKKQYRRLRMYYLEGMDRGRDMTKERGHCPLRSTVIYESSTAGMKGQNCSSQQRPVKSSTLRFNFSKVCGCNLIHRMGTNHLTMRNRGLNSFGLWFKLRPRRYWQRKFC